MIYRFYTAGSIPGIAGIFAGVAVEVDDASNTILDIVPLASGKEMTTSQAKQVEESQPQSPSETPKE